MPFAVRKLVQCLEGVHVERRHVATQRLGRMTIPLGRIFSVQILRPPHVAVFRRVAPENERHVPYPMASEIPFVSLGALTNGPPWLGSRASGLVAQKDPVPTEVEPERLVQYFQECR